MATEQAAENYTVEDLVALNPYNPDILNDLEKFVNEQVSPQTYNLDANLSLLRLYQQMKEQFKTLIVLSHYLETARFRQFWDEAAKNRNILEVVPGFEQAIQAYAVHLHSLTYQKVPRPVLAEAINIEGLSLDKSLEYHLVNSGWIIEKGGQSQVIVLPRNEVNHP